MSYYFSKVINLPFNEAIKKVSANLKEEGFGILTEIDVKETFRNKLDVDFKPYMILGACNPSFAYKALSSEDKIGVMLPCNVLVIQQENGVEVAAVDPVSSMLAIKNIALKEIAGEIQSRLKKVIEKL
jgi:uncharacterized protein (DUF302 family)